jgi:hypothetical protein
MPVAEVTSGPPRTTAVAPVFVTATARPIMLAVPGVGVIGAGVVVTAVIVVFMVRFLPA